MCEDTIHKRGKRQTPPHHMLRHSLLWKNPHDNTHTAMAAHGASSHPVNISEQKNITAQRTLNCFPCLSLWDSILLFFWRQGFRWHTASSSTFSTVVTSLPKFRGKKKLNPVKVSLSLRHIPATGINSGACHVWNIVGVRENLRKMDGTIKVRVEIGE